MRMRWQIDYAPFSWRWVISSYTGTTVGNAPRYVLEELRKQLDLVPDKALFVFRVSFPPQQKRAHSGIGNCISENFPRDCVISVSD